MPAAVGIEVSAVRERSIRRAAVKRVAHRVDVRVVAATLLPHEFQQLFRQVPVRVRTDGKSQRMNLSDDQLVFARGLNPGKVQFGVVFELTPGAVGDGGAFARETRALRICRNNRERRRDLGFG